MAKSTGLGATVAIDDAGGTARTISNDIESFNFSTPRGVQEVTGVDKSAVERLLLLADFSVSVDGIFNPASNMSHDVFKTVPSTSVNRTVSIKPTSNSTPVLACETLFSDYQIKRSNKGELTFTAPGNLADGSVPSWA